MKTLFRFAAVALAGFVLWVAVCSNDAAAQEICGSNNSGLLGNANQYMFLGDQWNSNFSYVNQCVDITNSTTPPPTSLSGVGAGPSSNYVSGTFDNTTSTPSDYPDFLYGEFRGNVTQNTQLPMAVTSITGSNPTYNVLSGENVVEPSGYNNDMAYDIWFNTYAGSPTGANTTGTELMIWVQHNGSAGTISGGPTYNFTDSTGRSWTAYTGTNTGNCGCSGVGSQVISFVRNGSDGPTGAGGYTAALNLDDFFTEALNVGEIQSSWYLTAIEFGTEIWVGGPGLQVNNFWVNIVPSSGSGSGGSGNGGGTEAPYGGTPAAIAGTVMAENYDTGGQGVGYNVTSTNGTDNAYRSDGVDLEASSSPATGNDVGWSAAGQWFRYTVNVATSGTYTVSFLVSDGSGAAVADAFHLSNAAGTNLTGAVAVPNTGGWQTWTTVTATVTLSAGVQTLTLNQDNGGWNLDSMDFTLNSSGGGTEGPFGGTAAAIAGTVMAENYDTGGQGVGYNVTSTNGTDNAYRSDGVDLETASTPATGNDLGWTAAGQWFNYTVNVSTAGTYTVTFLVSDGSGAAVADAFHLSDSSGADLTGSVAVPNTGGWQTWTTVTATVSLSAGVQTLTLNQDAGGWNIDSMVFAASGGTGVALNTWYNIVNQNSGSCVDDTASGTANGTFVQQWACGNQQYNQEWEFIPTSNGYYSVLNRNAAAENEVWDVTGGPGATSPGTPIQTWSNGQGTNQQWQPVSLGNGYYKFVVLNSGMCLDTPSASTANGVQLDAYTCNGTAAQAFKLVAQP